MARRGPPGRAIRVRTRRLLLVMLEVVTFPIPHEQVCEAEDRSWTLALLDVWSARRRRRRLTRSETKRSARCAVWRTIGRLGR